MKTNKNRESGFAHVMLVIVIGLVVFGAVGAFLVTRSHATTCTQLIFRQGRRGACVSHIQALVNYQNNGIRYHRIAVDGDFGPDTRRAVVAVQRYFGLSQDGVVGPRTWRAICATNAGPGIPGSYPLAHARAAGCRV